MATVTPNFNWPVPTSTDLVKDGATAIEALGDSIDGSLVDLKGGTTGQVLSKTSGTDMDFTWVTSDDANAIQNSIVDAKGDLIAASANDTPARLAVGANGETLVADSSTSTGLRYQGNFAAGKNRIINGDFYVNQRGFTSNTTSGAYNFDRFLQLNSGGTFTVTPQTFSPGAAPVAGYEGKNFVRGVTASQSASGDFAIITQYIEDVRTFANQTVTVSFWAKAASGTPSVTVETDQTFDIGSSTLTTLGKVTLSTSWTRYSVTGTLASAAGKTIAASGSSLKIYLWLSAGSSWNSRTSSLGIQNNTFDIWGVQVEAGSTATAFQTATGTIQGELSACQRYYVRFPNDTGSVFGFLNNSGYFDTTTNGLSFFTLPVEMRVAPGTVDYSANLYCSATTTNFAVSAVSINAVTGRKQAIINATVSGATVSNPAVMRANNSTSVFIGFSAEL
jgi:hypothetical protein